METATAPKTKSKDLIDIARNLGPTISKFIDEDESNRRLSAPVITALREAGFLKMFLPQSLGGLETDPVTTARVIEEIARHNTAAGWSLMVANTTFFTCAFLSPKGIEEIIGNNPDVFIAGSVHPPMRATKTDGGYLLNGRNPLLSNVHEAEWIFVTALVMDGDHPKMNEGRPEVIGAMMKASDCTIIDTWNTLGMRATDSNDAEAKNVHVPDHRAFPMIPDFEPGEHFKGSLYRIPATAANIACLLAPVALAVARNAIEELKMIAAKKTALGSMSTIREKGVVQRKLGQAEALIQSARSYLYETIANNWEKVRAGQTITLEEKATLLLASAHANYSSAEAVQMMYSAAGTHGIYMKNKMAHYFTDMQVIRQHGFMNESRYETVGQVYMGLPPDLHFVAF
jgi:indole-3-acetate monooxygenase